MDLRKLLMVQVMGLLFVASGLAQVATARLEGTIQDSAGAVVSGELRRGRRRHDLASSEDYGFVARLYGQRQQVGAHHHGAALKAQLSDELKSGLDTKRVHAVERLI